MLTFFGGRARRCFRGSDAPGERESGSRGVGGRAGSGLEAADSVSNDVEASWGGDAVGAVGEFRRGAPVEA